MSTCSSGWISQVMPSEPKHQTSCIWGSRPSTQQMNSGPLPPLLPDSEVQWMYPNGSRQVILLVKLQQIEWVGQGQNKTIVTKLILKLGGKIRIWGAKIFQWVDHLWTQLLLVRTQPMEQRHQLTQFLLGKKLQTPRHWHDQQIHQHY